ncbi:MAG: S8 family peptidase [Pseudomonadota bacterium]
MAAFCGSSQAATSKPLPGAVPMKAEPKVTQLILKPKRFDLARAQKLDEPSVAAFSQAAGIVMTHVRAMSGQAQVMRLPRGMSADEAQVYANRLVEAGLAEYAEPDRWVRPMRAPNDPFYASQQWHFRELLSGQAFGANSYGLNLPGAWDVTTGSSAIVVAVLDTGLLPHADIDSNILDATGRVKPGYDFVSVSYTDAGSGVIYPANDGDGRDDNPVDPGDWIATDDPVCGDGTFYPSSWHGTHVAGTIGALSDNNLGVAGVAWNVSLLPVRILGKCGGFTSDMVDGMRWSAGLAVPGVPVNPSPARVLNMSLGGASACGATEQAAIDEVRAQGAVVVVAAGNSGTDAADFSPASCSGVVTVAATDRQGQRAYYSNYGAPVDIAAPGGDSVVDTMIYSTVDSGTTTALNDNAYEAYQGTSMATPHVAGLVALMLERNVALTPDQVLTTLQATVTNFPAYDDSAYPGAASWNCTTGTCGAGIANAAAAIAALSDTVPDGFAFTAQDNVALSSVITSNTVTISGIDGAAPVSVSNGEYSIGCASDGFTSSPGAVSNGQTLCVRHISASTLATQTSTTLTVGGFQAVFSSTTVQPDATPDAFGFTTVNNASLSTPLTSNAVTISGINTATPVSVTGGEYSLGCTASFTSSAGQIQNGQTVCVRHTTASEYGTSATTTLNVGGVSGSFTSTTLSAPADVAESGGSGGGGGGGGGGASGLLGLAALMGLAWWRRRLEVGAARS